ncbi:iron-siderophore ABC transporter substrate-binding protein [Aldersonia kunmingensis]|uniref:ABC transporter substrate-binding protein n=1 Tax=Aldersonia kunmingensis TaxID=408066 RepID=UPI000830C9F3|nr:iron-siderophore ABC transporter substrate-binding protein [Aldersonia kunmingensis]
MPFRAASVRSRRLLGVLAASCALVAVAGCGSESDDDASTIIRTTTNIAGAGVVGVERDTTEACPAPAAPDAPAGGTREITHSAGVSSVPTDPQRIVVLSTQALDAMCALGLWERVVGAATLDGPSPQPGYLGYGVSAIPSVGTVGSPDPRLIEAARPDVIVGSDEPGSVSWGELDAIAPTVFTGEDDWRSEFRSTAAAVGRSTAGAQTLADYQQDAATAGLSVNSAQTEASVVRFTADAMTVLGSDSFAGQVLADTGTRRPGPQRGDSFEVQTDDLAALDGDLIYVVPAGDDGKEYAIKVMKSDDWRKLGAADDHRVFAMDDTVWSGNGVTAARALVQDITESLNGYVS